MRSISPRPSSGGFCRRWSMTTKEPSRLTRALLETADDMRRAGVIDALTHAKVTLRHLGNKADVVTEPISGPEIRKLREDAHCGSAWNKDPVFGVIGIQSGPPGRWVHSGFRGGYGGQVGDAGSGDDREDPSGTVCGADPRRLDIRRSLTHTENT